MASPDTGETSDADALGTHVAGVFSLKRSYLGQATQMSLRLTKLCGEKRLDQIPRDGWSYGPAAHAKNIHLIVLDTLPGRKMVVN